MSSLKMEVVWLHLSAYKLNHTWTNQSNAMCKREYAHTVQRTRNEIPNQEVDMPLFLDWKLK